MSGLTIYPRGFTTGPVDAPSRQFSNGDMVVDSLYDYLGSCRGQPMSWQFYNQVLEIALIHFGDFHSWLDAQLSNPVMIGHRRDYLIDTLKYINTGSRSVNQSAWSFIIEPIDIPPEKYHVFRHFESIKYLEKGLTTYQVLQKWCGHPKGINDLVTTMYVLFGHLGRTPA